MHDASGYDSFAWFYNLYWAQPFQDWQMPALERLLLLRLAPGARILDLCCGVGRLAGELQRRGFEVTGVDGSAEMLRYAAINAPGAELVHAPADAFRLARPVDAAVCTFDSVNHLLSLVEIRRAFENVRAALKPDGCFLCDVNTPGAYGEQWDGQSCGVGPDHAFFLRGNFDRTAGRGITEITMFRLREQWERADVSIAQRCYGADEIAGALRGAGFAEPEVYRAREDLGLEGHFGEGRVYLLACLAD